MQHTNCSDKQSYRSFLRPHDGGGACQSCTRSCMLRPRSGLLSSLNTKTNCYQIDVIPVCISRTPPGLHN